MTLRVGMIGYSFMGEAHVNALDRLPQFFPEVPETERTVLVGRREEPLADAADRFRFERTTTDWADALDDIDVLCNLGPNNLHAEPSIAALDRGVHVLCEKPLAATLADAKKMAMAATESDALAATGFNYRFVPAIQYAKELIESGELGDIRHFRGSYLGGHLAGNPEAGWSWRLSEDHAGAGALGDLGSHTIDIAHYLVGDIKRVQGRCRTFVDERPVPWSDETRAVDVDDAYAATVDFENGAMGTLTASRHAAGEQNNNSVAVHGTKGAVKFSLNRMNELQVYRDGNEGYETVMIGGDDHPYGDSWWPPAHNIGWEHTFVHEYASFLGAITEGGDHRPNFADGLAVQRVMDAVQRSDRTGERISL